MVGTSMLEVTHEMQCYPSKTQVTEVGDSVLGTFSGQNSHPKKTSPLHFPSLRLRFALPQVAGAIPGLAGAAALPGLGAAAAIPGLARLPGLAPKAEGPVYTGQVVDYNEARPPLPAAWGWDAFDVFFSIHPVLRHGGYEHWLG